MDTYFAVKISPESPARTTLFSAPISYAKSTPKTRVVEAAVQSPEVADKTTNKKPLLQEVRFLAPLAKITLSTVWLHGEKDPVTKISN